jgi:hypothetical protein
LRHRLHVDRDPARILLRGLRIEVLAAVLELRRIRIGAAGHAGDAGHAGHRAAGVVEQDAVAGLHLVAHEVAGLVVAHAEPGERLSGALRTSSKLTSSGSDFINQ